MKFEYELNYDFVNSVLAFKILKQPESLRKKSKITKITVDDSEWCIECMSYPEIVPEYKTVFLRGYSQRKDEYTDKLTVNFETAQTIAKVLEKFAEWVESKYGNETVMTVAEIEEKLGVKNLKIVKEEQE